MIKQLTKYQSRRNNMDNTNHLINNILSIKNNISNLHIYFIERIKEGKNEYDYIIYNPNISRALNNELSSLVLNYIIKVLEGKTLVEHDPICCEDSTIETINPDEVDNLIKIYNKIISIDQNPANLEDLDLSRVWGYCFMIEGINNETVLLFKKYSHAKALKHGFQLFFNNGTLDKFDNKVIPIDERIDVFLYSNKLYILNKYFFELMFSYSDTYLNVLEEALQRLEANDIIVGFEEFKDACLDNNKIAKKFTKIMRENGLQTFLENIDSISDVINDFQLNIQLVNNKLLYEDKSNLPEILKLLSNDYVRAALDKKNYEAVKKKPC